EKVSKSYRSGLLHRRGVDAVRAGTLTISGGEVFALLGPNRAGKTTLVKMLLGLCRPTAGAIFRFDRPVADAATLARIGYMHERHAFPPYLTAGELLHFYGALALVPDEELRRRVPGLLERVGLADRS